MLYFICFGFVYIKMKILFEEEYNDDIVEINIVQSDEENYEFISEEQI